MVEAVFRLVIQLKMMIINPMKNILLKLFLFIIMDYLYLKIVQELIETKVVETFTKTRVNTILHNSNYCGNSSFPQLINSELFNQVQEKIKIQYHC